MVGPRVWVIKFTTLLARAAVVVKVIVSLKLDDPREHDLLRAVDDVGQQLWLWVVVEVAELWQLGIDAGVKAVPRWRGMVESRSAKQPASFEV